MRLFHYHLVTSEVRTVEARYVGRLGFRLVARYGRVGDESLIATAGTSWEELDGRAFRLRLSELQLGAVNVVVQPGHWRVPRVDHLGIVLEEEELEALLERAGLRNLPVQERGSRRTFVSIDSGYRIEVHPPRDWIEEMLDSADVLELAELQLRTDRPEHQAQVLADILDIESTADAVAIGTTLVRFVPGGPEGRPELHGERFG